MDEFAHLRPCPATPWVQAMLIAVAVLAIATCSTGEVENGIRPDCTAVDVATSSQKIDLLGELAAEFNQTAQATGAGTGPCRRVRLRSVDSGVAATRLADDWSAGEPEGPPPVLWSPASRAWGAIMEQRRAEAGKAPITSSDAKPFMDTPVVIAMPRPMAEALGWPDTPIAYRDLLALARHPNGWGSKGHPEWGPFKLGKTNPNISTSGLSSTIAQYYAATGATELSLEAIDRPEVADFNRAVESAVVHYGDSATTFLDTWYRKDAAGAGLTYVSAVAVEEKRLIDYNRGDPDGVRQAGEHPKAPRIPLVAVYPVEGTLFSDNPLYVLDAPWVSEAERAVAEEFVAWVLRPTAQRRVLAAGFRPGNPQVTLGPPLESINGVDPAQPQTNLAVPPPDVLVRLIERWNEQRKGARVLLVIDVSGSMGEPASASETKLDLAKRAAIDALALFQPHDEVGLRVFSTAIGPAASPDYVDLVGIEAISENRERLKEQIRRLVPTAGTPLYEVTQASFLQLRTSHDPSRINAMVLLTDGRNDDTFSELGLDALVDLLESASEGTSAAAVRVFTIAYGKDADVGTLERIARSTDASAYDASDPASITEVFTAVVSNF